jgi:hypothetical protein
MALTREQKNEARRLWDDGKSYGQIAMKFGVSKNVVAGVRNLEGWPKHGETAPTKPARQKPATGSTLPMLPSLA